MASSTDTRVTAREGKAAGTRRTRVAISVLTAAALVLAGAVAYGVTRLAAPRTVQEARPSGIPASISTPLANLMGLDPLPNRPAPSFTLTDQNGHTMPLSALRGKAVVLEFMDPHCTDICPIIAAELVDAYRDLGPGASKKVVFAAVNVNPYYPTAADVAAFTTAHQLNTIPWHFFTGATPALRAAWHAYNIAVELEGPKADIVHTSVVYFIDPHGNERYLAAPQDEATTKPRTAYGTQGETGYVSPADMASWGQGMAALVRSLTG